MAGKGHKTIMPIDNGTRNSAVVGPFRATVRNPMKAMPLEHQRHSHRPGRATHARGKPAASDRDDLLAALARVAEEHRRHDRRDITSKHVDQAVLDAGRKLTCGDGAIRRPARPLQRVVLGVGERLRAAVREPLLPRGLVRAREPGPGREAQNDGYAKQERLPPVAPREQEQDDGDDERCASGPNQDGSRRERGRQQRAAIEATATQALVDQALVDEGDRPELKKGEQAIGHHGRRRQEDKGRRDDGRAREAKGKLGRRAAVAGEVADS